jgi:ankyrin repeat protein
MLGSMQKFIGALARLSLVILASGLFWSTQSAKAQQDDKMRALEQREQEAIAQMNADEAQNFPPLRVAVENGDAAWVKQLLDGGADVNQQFENHFTVIYLAPTPEIADLLLAKKPDLEIRAGMSETPLESIAEECARKNNDPALRSICDRLLAAGAQYTVDAAIYLNDIDRVKKLLKAHDPEDPPWVNATQGAHSVPLRVAAMMGRDDICKLLLDNKADPNDFKQGLGFPIIVDAMSHPTIVKMLIAAGADLKTRITWRGGKGGLVIIGDNATALHYAGVRGNQESVQLLIDAGIDVNAVDAWGQTALIVAVREDGMNAGRGPAADAIAKSRLDVIKYLAHGSSLTAADTQGRTALDWAKQIKKQDVIDALTAASRPTTQP